MPKNKASNYVAAQERVPEDTSAAPSHEDIAVLAYELWISRGRGDGADEEDWFEAERQLGVGNGQNTTA